MESLNLRVKNIKPSKDHKKLTQETLEGVGLTSVQLRDYQLLGVNWLLSCYETNSKNGCILGDEMGLGKTLQTLSFILLLQKVGKATSPCLVIGPLSVLGNWTDEFERWAPSLKLLLYMGDKESREQKRNSISGNMKHHNWKNSACPFDVLLTSYELCLKDSNFLQRFKWNVLVVDEAHRLKNFKSMLYQELVEFDIKFRLLLTGTPVQNNLQEIYSLLSFISSNIFKLEDNEAFVEHFNKVTTDVAKGTNDELHLLLKPFLLRRVKDEVMKELPKKSEVILYTGMSSIQKKLYKAVLTKDYNAFSSEGPNRTRLMNILMQLRKCCSHPYIFPGIEPEPFEIGDHLIEASGKLNLLDKLLAFLNASGHKVLLFSQFTMMLDIVQDYLAYRGYTYERLDGSVRGEERYLAVNNFNESDDTFLFLLSTRAGGQGLNLMTADTVIFLDSDFNPQNDLQDAARAHRIGQTRPVKIIRLVSKNTVEEIILKRAESKLKLTEVVIEGGQFSSYQNISEAPNQLTDILKFGLEDLLNEDETSSVSEDFNSVLGGTINGEWLLEECETKPCSEESKDEQMDQENMYVFEGRDYSKDASDADKSAFDSMIASALNEIDANDRSTRRDKNVINFVNVLELPKRKRKELTDEEKEERRKKRVEAAAKRAKLAEEEEIKKAAEKKKRRERFWHQNSYETSNIIISDESSDESDSEADFETDEADSQLQIQYVVGDVTKPLNTGKHDAIIIHCVDDSGRWGYGGVFTALSNRSSKPKENYELAGKMKDLALGDAHLVAVDDRISRETGNDLVALIVAQKRDRYNQLSPILMTALTKGFERVQKEAKRRKATIHFPRIGHNTPHFNWYGTERIIKKMFTSKGIPSSVYYFPRRNRVVVSDLPNPQPSLDSAKVKDTSYDKEDAKSSKTELLDIFTGKSFYLNELEDIDKRRMTRYIVAYDGDIDTIISEGTSYIVVKETDAQISDSAISPSAAQTVTLQWVENCITKRSLLQT